MAKNKSAAARFTDIELPAAQPSGRFARTNDTHPFSRRVILRSLFACLSHFQEFHFYAQGFIGSHATAGQFRSNLQSSAPAHPHPFNPEFQTDD